MGVDVDTEVGAAYLALTKEAVSRTVEVTGSVMVDLDINGSVVGVELIDLQVALPEEALRRDFGIPDDEIKALKAVIRAA